MNENVAKAMQAQTKQFKEDMKQILTANISQLTEELQKRKAQLTTISSSCVQMYKDMRRAENAAEEAEWRAFKTNFDWLGNQMSDNEPEAEIPGDSPMEVKYKFTEISEGPEHGERPEEPSEEFVPNNDVLQKRKKSTDVPLVC